MTSPDNLIGIFQTEQEHNVDFVLDAVAHLVGFRPIELSNQPPQLKEWFANKAEELRFLREKGLLHKPVIHDDEHRSILTFELTPHVPQQFFAITEELIAAVEVLEEKLQRRLTETELELVSLCCVKDAVNPQFTPDAANDINALYYALPEVFLPETKLATLFVENRVINEAVGRYISRTTARGSLRIHEMSAGGRADKWQHILPQLAEKQRISLVLSDFIVPELPDPNVSPNVESMTARQYSLFDELPILPETEKVDVLFTTYGFDSVWLNQDARYIKDSGKWYRVLNRVKVLDSHPDKEKMLAALRSGHVDADLKPEDFGSILIESVVEEVAIKAVPFGDQISQFYDQEPAVRINFPGGLLEKVQEGFKNQLSSDGVFIIGDVTCYDVGKLLLTRASSVTGIAGRYKVEDYYLAKHILEQIGYVVEISQLGEFANAELGDWQKGASAKEIDQIENSPSNIVMTVRRAVVE